MNGLILDFLSAGKSSALLSPRMDASVEPAEPVDGDSKTAALFIDVFLGADHDAQEGRSKQPPLTAPESQTGAENTVLNEEHELRVSQDETSELETHLPQADENGKNVHYSGSTLKSEWPDSENQEALSHAFEVEKDPLEHIPTDDLKNVSSEAGRTTSHTLPRAMQASGAEISSPDQGSVDVKVQPMSQLSAQTINAHFVPTVSPVAALSVQNDGVPKPTVKVVLDKRSNVTPTPLFPAPSPKSHAPENHGTNGEVNEPRGNHGQAPRQEVASTPKKFQAPSPADEPVKRQGLGAVDRTNSAATRNGARTPPVVLQHELIQQMPSPTPIETKPSIRLEKDPLRAPKQPTPKAALPSQDVTVETRPAVRPDAHAEPEPNQGRVRLPFAANDTSMRQANGQPAPFAIDRVNGQFTQPGQPKTTSPASISASPALGGAQAQIEIRSTEENVKSSASRHADMPVQTHSSVPPKPISLAPQSPKKPPALNVPQMPPAANEIRKVHHEASVNSKTLAPKNVQKPEAVVPLNTREEDATLVEINRVRPKPRPLFNPSNYVDRPAAGEGRTVQETDPGRPPGASEKPTRNVRTIHHIPATHLFTPSEKSSNGTQKSEPIPIAVTEGIGAPPTAVHQMQGTSHAAAGLTASSAPNTEVPRMVHGPLPGQPMNLTDQLATVVTRVSQGTVRVQLSPEELGAVTMNIVQDGRGLHLSVIADRSDTVDLLHRHLSPLTQELERMGFERVSVDLSNSSDRSAGQHSNGGAPHQTRTPAPQGAFPSGPQEEPPSTKEHTQTVHPSNDNEKMDIRL